MSNFLMSGLPICCCPAGAKLKVHVTMLFFFVIAMSTSLQFAHDYPVGVTWGDAMSHPQCAPD